MQQWNDLPELIDFERARDKLSRLYCFHYHQNGKPKATINDYIAKDRKDVTLIQESLAHKGKNQY